MVTILGQHISLIRPALIKTHKISQGERPQIRYNTKPKNIKEHTGKVIAVCIKLAGDKIMSLPTPATHFQVCDRLEIDTNAVSKTGWQLDNGNYLWR